MRSEGGHGKIQEGTFRSKRALLWLPERFTTQIPVWLSQNLRACPLGAFMYNPKAHFGRARKGFRETGRSRVLLPERFALRRLVLPAYVCPFGACWYRNSSLILVCSFRVHFMDEREKSQGLQKRRILKIVGLINDPFGYTIIDLKFE